jgi:hypothetical protein
LWDLVIQTLITVTLGLFHNFDRDTAILQDFRRTEMVVDLGGNCSFYKKKGLRNAVSSERSVLSGQSMICSPDGSVIVGVQKRVEQLV